MAGFLVAGFVIGIGIVTGIKRAGSFRTGSSPKLVEPPNRTVRFRFIAILFVNPWTRSDYIFHLSKLKLYRTVSF